MDQVLIQLVMDAQGEVSLEYLADMGRLLPPREDRQAAGPQIYPKEEKNGGRKMQGSDTF